MLVNTGSTKKKFIIHQLKKLGLKLIVLNKEKNWAQPYVDHWILTDTYDHPEAVRMVGTFLKNNPQIKVDGALTFWEDDVLLTAKIIDKFGFIGIPYHIAKRVRNKYLFRQFCAANGVKTPKYKLVKDLPDLDYISANFQFPLVIKPAYGSSSAYVVKVENKEELVNTHNYIKKNISTDTETALSDGLDIFVEEYIDGDEVDIDIILQNGKIKFYTISDNFNKDKGVFFVDSGQSIPSNLPMENQKKLIELAEETLEKIGIQNGIIHFEAKTTKKGAYPIEVNMRMGGDYVFSYIKGAWNINLIEYAVRIALGDYIAIKRTNPHKYIIGWDLHPDSSGLLVELNVEDELHKKKYFEEIHIYKQVGDPILLPPEGYESLGWLTISGDNFLDTQDNLREALNYVKFKVLKFDEDSSVGKTLRKNRFSSAVLNKNLLIKAARLERVRKATQENLRNLHIGIAGNSSEYYYYLDSPKKDNPGKEILSCLQNKNYHVNFFDFNNFAKAINEIKQNNVDLVINAIDPISYPNSQLKIAVSSALDILQIPYTGSEAASLAISRDKIKFKKLLDYHEIPTPKWDYVYNQDEELDDELQYPMIIKPAYTDSSLGISADSVVTNQTEAKKQITNVLAMGMPALVEEYIEGDEYAVCILGNTQDNIQVLPLARTLFKKPLPGKWNIYSYETKWVKERQSDNFTIQRPLKNISKKLESLITEISLDVYKIMDCKDYGQLDIRVDEDDNPYVLELNPNPPLLPNSNLTSTAKLLGMDFDDLLETIIDITIKRYRHLQFKNLRP